MAGRPSDYSEELAALICERLSDGMSLREICAAGDMPHKSTVFRWAASNETFRDQYARAREAQAEHMADDILDIADNATNDWMVRHGEDDAGWQANGEHMQRSRLRIDSRKWLLSKLLPKKYGEKVEVGGSGKDGAIVHRIEMVIVDPKS